MERNVFKEMISESSQFDREKLYWLSKFSGEITKSYFPYDFISNNGFNRDAIEFKVPGDLFSRLNHLTNRSDNNLFVVLAASLTILLSKYTGNEDIVIGIPILKQEEEGEFLNVILAQRNQAIPMMKLKEFLLQVKQTINEANDNSNYPIERLLYYLGLEEKESSLFETVILLQNIHEQKYIEKMNYQMVFLFKRSEQLIEGILEYNNRLYQRKTAENIVSHFLNVMQNMINDLSAAISDIDIISGKEREMLLAAFNDTHALYPGDKLFYELFEERVMNKPNNKAAASLDDNTGDMVSISYTRLNERANQLARFLAEKGVGADTIIGIMVKPSLEMVVGIMAISKAGGAFLPLDPESPMERIEYLLDESNCVILLTQDPFLETTKFKGEKINIKNKSLYTANNSNLPRKNRPQDLFYTIYTSGTTGRPKGGLLTHRNLVNYVTWFSRAAQLTDKDKTILTSSYAFDLGYSIFLGSLATGGELHIVSREIYFNAKQLLNYIKDKGISYVKMTPSLFSIVVNSNFFSMETCSTLRLVVLGGEEINTQDVEKAHYICDHIKFMNHYGPTETTIGSVSRFIDFNRYEEYKSSPTIGKPIHNTHVYILDQHFKLMPIGVPGELFIAGRGVGRGYLNRQELTSLKFISHPMIKHERIYRTGDLARWMPDGNIHFLGRKDNQVKIRGYRIELEEIENQILKSEKVKEVVVIAREDKGTGRYLCAYIVSSYPGNSFNIGELKDFLSGNLPDFMIPLYFNRIDRIPLASGGKIDHKALPKPELTIEEDYVSPRDEIEEKLTGIWSEILGLKKEKIGIDMNFFEAGGHSLRAAFLAAAVNKHFNVNISMVKIFEAPTVRGLAEHVKSTAKTHYITVEPAEKKEYYDLSLVQQRFYIQQKLYPENMSYIMPILFIMEGRLEKDKQEDVFQELIKRNENFRTSFEALDDRVVQRVYDEVDFSIDYYETGEEEVDKLIEQLTRPLDLARPPLIRVALIKLAELKHLIKVDIHHIINDGITFGLFITELMAIYAGKKLPPLKLQYMDFSEWQSSGAQQENIKKQGEYWNQQFKNGVPGLELPHDYPRPPIQRFEGDSMLFGISAQETIQLRDMALANETSMYMILFSIYFLLLWKLTGQEDIVVGTAVSGRRHTSLMNIMGLFFNTLPIRHCINRDKTFAEYLRNFKETLLKSFENQDYPLDKLVADLAEASLLSRNSARNPFFDTMFSLQNFEILANSIPEIEIPDLKLIPYQYETRSARFDLFFITNESEETIEVIVEYSTTIFKKSTIEKIVRHYREIVSRVLEKKDIILRDIMLSSEFLKVDNRVEKDELSNFGF